MKLWTVQPKAVVDKLELGKPLFACPDFAAIDYEDSPMFLPAYQWMAVQLAKRLDGRWGQWPWWAWARPDYRTKTGAPNMRYYKRPYDTYLIELDIPDRRVLLSDYQLFHCVLNNWDLTIHEGEQVDKVQSWQRIFAIDALGNLTVPNADPEWVQVTDNAVQACFWQLDPAQVISIKHYKGTK